MSVSHKKNILITGATRGLGYALVKEFINDSWNVIAGIRNYNNINHENLGKSYLPVKLDVTNTDDINLLKKQLKGNTIDVIIHNAGLYLFDVFGKTSVNNMLKMYETHVIAPLMLTEHLMEYTITSKYKLIILITSRMGSFGNSTGGGSYGYRASKAAANMIAKTLAIDLEKYGTKVLSIHPGWIKTAIGGDNALIEPFESAKGIKRIVLDADRYLNGGYYTYQGEKLEW